MKKYRTHIILLVLIAISILVLAKMVFFSGAEKKSESVETTEITDIATTSTKSTIGQEIKDTKPTEKSDKVMDGRVGATVKRIEEEEDSPVFYQGGQQKLSFMNPDMYPGNTPDVSQLYDQSAMTEEDIISLVDPSAKDMIVPGKDTDTKNQDSKPNTNSTPTTTSTSNGTTTPQTKPEVVTKPETKPETKPTVTEITFANDELKDEVIRALSNADNLLDASKVLKNIDKKTYKVTKEDLENLKVFSTTILYSDNKSNDLSLKGLENAINLESLQLSHSKVLDFSLLPKFTKLKKLNINTNPNFDLNLLKDLTKLEDLNISGSGYSSLDKISSLVNLKKLNISENKISDLTPLSNMKNLEELYAVKNEISNLAPLNNLSNLTMINMDSNKISSLSGLGNKENLSSLDVSNNTLNDVNGVEKYKNLKTLYIISNKNISDLSPLKDLTNLRYLSVRDNNITDVSPLANLKNLIYLHLYENKIQDISVVKNMPELRELNISKNMVSDLNPVKNLTHLRVLFAYQNRVADPSAILALGNIRVLNISQNRVYDLTSSKVQTQDDKKQQFIVNKQTANLSTGVVKKVESGNNYIVTIKNPVKNINGAFVKVDSSKVEELIETEPIKEGEKGSHTLFNEINEKNKALGISMKSIGNNELIEITMPKAYFDNKELNIEIPFLEREGITVMSYDTDFPDIAQYRINPDNSITDPEFKGGDFYEMKLPYGGTINMNIKK